MAIKVSIIVPIYNVERYLRKCIDSLLVQTLKDIEKIPFTTKDDLREAYPFGLFAVPYEEIVEIHASSGTSGKPTVTGYTKEDLDIWSECIARGLGMVGVEKEYILQNAFGYGLFTGGFGIHH